MNTPMFSIVTINYQNLDGLRETVESVRSQSFRDFEHIVVDGGSTDGSAEWTAANFDGAWVSEPDGGRYDAMNKGARMSSGEYLWFLHSGDLFGDDDVLARVASAIQTRPEGLPDWLYGLARVVNADKSLRTTLGFVPFNMFNFAILQRPLPHQASVFRRDFFWRLGAYDTEVGIAADQLFMLRAATSSTPMTLADFLCDFDCTGISANRSWWANNKDRHRILRQLETPIARWRTLDILIAYSYGLLRQLGFLLRAGVGRR
ncbi:glycosyltransferase family 2 protein [Mycobacterium sp. E740]|uniref:glycosyltransferase family 2 protein n=1 Tax=Mycobacterium sp. E740 TaxID=1834149 RepID=UPI000800980F|nr:glycosyltransferase family 2 protein [Mycobacterium sp. E740]OBI74856.1 hypothetical protein A5663_00430 [Mycobacterium sp. E740]